MLIKGRSGFTFVELMLTAAIFTVISIAIYATFNSGISAWKKAQQAEGTYQDLRLGLEQAAEELENAVSFKQEEDFINFTGSQESISFYTPIKRYVGRLRHPEIKKVTYAFSDSILRRTEQSPVETAEEEPPEPEDVTLNIEELKFFYYYLTEDSEQAYQWQNDWQFGANIPRAIKIEVRPKGVDIILTKYLLIPPGITKVPEE